MNVAHGNVRDTIHDEAELDELLSRPSPEVVALFRRLKGKGPLAIVGATGKIGPSLVATACRARDHAGGSEPIYAIARFTDPAVRGRLEKMGAQTMVCDLLDPLSALTLPDAAHVLYLAGHKFGTTGRPDITWATNALAVVPVSEKFRKARIVAFSTGCVYPMAPIASGGSVETDPLEPLGEYSNACVARERFFEYFAHRNQTPVLQIRLNYAVEMRYGVLVDLAAQIAAGRPVDVSMGYFNVIWQGDVNNYALRLLEHTALPPAAFNLTGPEKLATREVALRLGELMGKPVNLVGTEAPDALLSNASRAHHLLGLPTVGVETLLKWTADWIGRGEPTLGKPTHFQARDGRY